MKRSENYRVFVRVAKGSVVGSVIMTLSVIGMYFVDEEGGMILAAIAAVLFVIALISRWYVEKNRSDI